MGEARRLMSDVQEHPLYKRALECTTDELNLNGESVCLAACGAGLCAFRSGWHASFGRWRVCVRSGGRVWRFWMLSDCVCPAAVF